jgi:hypothetical protein
LIGSIELVQVILSVKVSETCDGADNPAEELGPVVNIIVEELLGVCSTCELHLFEVAKAYSASPSASIEGEPLLIYIYNFHVLSNLLLIFICKLHWNYEGVTAAAATSLPGTSTFTSQ